MIRVSRPGLLVAAEAGVDDVQEVHFVGDPRRFIAELHVHQQLTGVTERPQVVVFRSIGIWDRECTTTAGCIKRRTARGSIWVAWVSGDRRAQRDGTRKWIDAVRL